MTLYKRNLLILSITVCLSSLSWTQIIPFLPKYLLQLGVKNNLTAWSALVLGVHSLAGIVFLPFWGKMGDKYGRKPMVIRAGLCLSAIYIGMIFCTKAWHLVMFRFLNGMLTGFLPGSFALIATNTPKEKAGRYVAIAQSTAAIGTIAGPVSGGILFDIVGIRGTLWVSGICVLLITIAVGLFVSEPNKAMNIEATSLIDDFVKCWRDRTLRYIMTHNWINSIMAGVIPSTLIIYLSQISPKLPISAQGTVYAIPGILIALMSLRWVKLGEKISYSKVITVGLIGAGFFYILMGFSINAWMFIPAFILCRGFATALSPSLSALITTKVSPEFHGRAFGIQTSVGTMGELFAQVLVASIGQFLGIHILYLIIGMGVLALGLRNHLGYFSKSFMH